MPGGGSGLFAHGDEGVSGRRPKWSGREARSARYAILGQSIHLTDEDRMTRVAGAMTRRRFAAASAMAFGALVRARPAQAAYPERPIKIVVANTPGGPSDLIAHIIAAPIQHAIG